MPTVPTYFQTNMSPAINNPPSSSADNDTTTQTLPIRKHKFQVPKIRLQLNDLSHEGSSVFLSRVKGYEDVSMQVENVLNLLYTKDSIRPGTRSVTLVLRSMNGVAYTTGSDLDEDHKEIHVNLNYIRRCERDEILGVVCHELVHCFQWNAENSCPGGLVEGVADWVRLRAGLGAKHWKQDADGKWDAGYQHTGYFLEYLEQRFGEGTVRHMNECLRKGKWDQQRVFGECCQGHGVKELWEEYGEDLKKKQEKGELPTASGAQAAIPTHAVGQDQSRAV
ncbi:hypothetical protein MBLNU230_g5121t1 [Neophaeotheca triangularis]